MVTDTIRGQLICICSPVRSRVGPAGGVVVQGSDRREPVQPAAKLHVAALLEREGHPLRTEVTDNGGGIGRGKIVGIAAGTMLVAGAVAASALGLSGQG